MGKIYLATKKKKQRAGHGMWFIFELADKLLNCKYGYTLLSLAEQCQKNHRDPRRLFRSRFFKCFRLGFNAMRVRGRRGSFYSTDIAPLLLTQQCQQNSRGLKKALSKPFLKGFRLELNSVRKRGKLGSYNL